MEIPYFVLFLFYLVFSSFGLIVLSISLLLVMCNLGFYGVLGHLVPLLFLTLQIRSFRPMSVNFFND